MCLCVKSTVYILQGNCDEGGNKMLFDKNRNSWETFSSIFVYSVLDMENIVCRFVHENK